MSNFQSQYGYGPRPGMGGGPGMGGMGGGPGFNMQGNRGFMGGQGGYGPQSNMMGGMGGAGMGGSGMGGPGMGGPGMGGPGMMQRPIPPFRSGPMNMGGPRMGGPSIPTSFPSTLSAPSPTSTTIAPPRATTVYVGKIAASIPDAVVRDLLEACGTIKSWNPVKEPSGQSKGFGFCEYEDGEGALRSLRLLNNLKVDGQELLLKPNTATQKYLVWYEQQKDTRRRQKEIEKAEREARKNAEDEEKADNPDESEEDDADKQQDDAKEELDEAAQEQAMDDLALAIIMGIVSGRSTPPPPDSGEKSKDRDKSRERSDRERERAPGPRSPRDGFVPADERRRSAVADLDPEAARERALEVEFERDRERRRRIEEEQKWREDQQYMRRLEMWERHEREKTIDKERERDRQKDAERERARFIKADLEARESDDEREPWQRRSVRSHRRTEERRKRRQREMFEDEQDRKKELQELAELAAKQPPPASPEQASADGLKQEDGMKQEVDQQDTAAMDFNQLQQQQQEVKQEVKQEQKPLVDSKDEIFQAMLAAAAGSAPPSSGASPPLQPQQQQQPAVAPRPAAAGASSLARKGGRKLAVSSLFGDDEDDNSKRRKLVPIKYTDEEMRAVEDHSAAVAEAAAGAAAAASRGNVGPQKQNDGLVPVYPPGLDVGGRKAYLRQWMDSLPNTRDSLHAFPVRWQFMNDGSLKNITSWVSKKVPELVGMEEPDLVDFIMANVRKQASADALEAELEPILAQDAGSFVMKLKRLIIYECERTALLDM